VALENKADVGRTMGVRGSVELKSINSVGGLSGPQGQ